MTRRPLTAPLAPVGMLAGCTCITANDGVHTPRRAVHPGASPLAQNATPATAGPIAVCLDDPAITLAEQRFTAVCRGKTVAQSQAALARSNRFGTPQGTQSSAPGARNATSPLLSRARAGVTEITSSGKRSGYR